MTRNKLRIITSRSNIRSMLEKWDNFLILLLKTKMRIQRLNRKMINSSMVIMVSKIKIRQIETMMLMMKRKRKINLIKTLKISESI